MISEGGVMPPWYYGIAYYDPFTSFSIFLPMPLNFLVRWWRLFVYHWNEWRGYSPPHIVLTRDEFHRLQWAIFEKGRLAERQFNEQCDRENWRQVAALIEANHANSR
jgi:hypothetical protein